MRFNLLIVCSLVDSILLQSSITRYRTGETKSLRKNPNSVQTLLKTLTYTSQIFNNNNICEIENKPIDVIA